MATKLLSHLPLLGECHVYSSFMNKGMINGRNKAIDDTKVCDSV